MKDKKEERIEEKKYNPEKEIEKKCAANKIFFVKGKEDYNDICDIGLGTILDNEIINFLKRNETNGFYILKVKNPNSEEEYKIHIKY